MPQYRIPYDKFLDKYWNRSTRTWGSPEDALQGSHGLRRRGRRAAVRTSNMQWLAENATPWSVPGYPNMGPSKGRVAAARRIMNALGPRVNRMKPGIINNMLNVMGRHNDRGPQYAIGRNAQAIGTNNYMRKMFEEEYLLPAEARLKGMTGDRARAELRKRRKHKKTFGGGWLGF